MGLRKNYRMISLALLGAVWLVTAYRAATQSIVHDEALTWQFYLATPASMMFEYYDANLHFLVVVLMRMVTAVFGYSELAMRLVSLGGGGLLLYGLWRLCTRVFGESLAALGAVGLVALNPLVLDFMVAARGYGPALALLVTGLWLGVEALEEAKPEWKRVALAGVCLGGSFAANLVFALPALAVAGAFWWKARGRGAWVKWLPAGLAAVGVLLFLFSPIAKARGENFYVGMATVKESVENLAGSALSHNDGVGEWNRKSEALAAWGRVVGWGIVPLLVAAGLWMGRGAKRGPELLGWLCAVAMGGPAVVLLAGHAAAGMPLPVDRTGLYFLGLAGLLLAAVAANLAARGGGLRVAGWVVAGIGVVIGLEYAGQMQTRSFLVWRYDADTRELLETARGRVQGPATAGVSWLYEPASNFYRVTKKWEWLKPVTRDGVEAGGDFFLVLPWEAGVVEKMKLKVVAQGGTSGTLLCVRGE